MKFVLIVLGCICAQFSLAQFAVVKSSTVYCAVYEEPQKQSSVIDSLSNQQIVFCFEKNAHWMNVDYEKENEIRNGFIPCSQIEPIENYTQIPLINFDGKEAQIFNQNISIVIEEKDFIQSNHSLQYSDQGLLYIDDQPYWGTDGNIPQEEFNKMEISLNGKNIVLPSSALLNLYNPNLASTAAHYDEQNQILYIYMLNGDGAGSYVVIWRIKQGQYQDRLIFYGF